MEQLIRERESKLKNQRGSWIRKYSEFLAWVQSKIEFLSSGEHNLDNEDEMNVFVQMIEVSQCVYPVGEVADFTYKVKILSKSSGF